MAKWTPDRIPKEPHIAKRAKLRFYEALSNAETYLEFGSGGSTIYACENCPNLKHVISVESFKEFLEAVKQKTGNNQKLIPLFIDVGPVKRWGYPKASEFKECWIDYPTQVWNEVPSSCIADLVLIDGRWRVACFLASIQYLQPGTTIFFDDYKNRTNYHVVEKYIEPTTLHGTLAEFVIPDQEFKVLHDFKKYIRDPR